MKKVFSLFILVILASSNILFAQLDLRTPSAPAPIPIPNPIEQQMNLDPLIADAYTYMQRFTGDKLFIKHPNGDIYTITTMVPMHPNGHHICIHPSLEHKDGDEIPCVHNCQEKIYWDGPKTQTRWVCDHDHDNFYVFDKPFCIHGQFEHSGNDCPDKTLCFDGQYHCIHPKFEHPNKDCPEGIYEPCLDLVPNVSPDPTGEKHECLERMEIKGTAMNGKLIFMTDNVKLQQMVIDGITALQAEGINILVRPLFIFNRPYLEGYPSDNTNPFWSHYSSGSNAIQITAGLSGNKMRETVYHELGHASIGTACSYIPTPGNPHSLKEETDAAEALSEGWAHFVAMFMNNQNFTNYKDYDWQHIGKFIRDIGDQNLDSISNARFNSGYNKLSIKYEFLAGKMFVDLVDDNGDDKVHVSFQDIYRTFSPSLEALAVGAFIHHDVIDWGNSFYSMYTGQNKFEDIDLQFLFQNCFHKGLSSDYDLKFIETYRTINQIQDFSETTTNNVKDAGSHTFDNGKEALQNIVDNKDAPLKEGEETSKEIYSEGEKQFVEGEKVVKQGYYQGKQDGQQVVDNGINTGNQITGGGKEFVDQGLKQGQEIIDNGIQGGKEIVDNGINYGKKIVGYFTDGSPIFDYSVKLCARYTSIPTYNFVERRMDPLMPPTTNFSIDFTDIHSNGYAHSVCNISPEEIPLPINLNVEDWNNLWLNIYGPDFSSKTVLDCELQRISTPMNVSAKAQSSLYKVFSPDELTDEVMVNDPVNGGTKKAGMALVNVGCYGYAKNDKLKLILHTVFGKFEFTLVVTPCNGLMKPHYTLNINDHIIRSQNYFENPSFSEIQKENTIYTNDTLIMDVRLHALSSCMVADPISYQLYTDAPFIFIDQHSIIPHFVFDDKPQALQNEKLMLISKPDNQIPDDQKKDGYYSFYILRPEVNIEVFKDYLRQNEIGLNTPPTFKDYDLLMNWVMDYTLIKFVYGANPKNSTSNTFLTTTVNCIYNNMPLENVEVTLGTSSEPEKFGKIISGKDGRAVFSNLPPNTDVIAKASAQGYIIDPLQFNSGSQSQTQNLNIKVMQMIVQPNKQIQPIKVIKPK